MSKVSRPGGLREEAAAVRDEKIARAQAPWTEQQERLLRAAQEIVNEVERVSKAYDLGSVEIKGGSGGAFWVDGDSLENLKAIVQEIGDDAAARVRAIAEEVRTEKARTCGDVGRTNGRTCKLPKGHLEHTPHKDGQGYSWI